MSSRALFMAFAVVCAMCATVPLAAAPVDAAHCESPPPSALPDPGACQSVAGLALPATASPARRAEALVSLAKERIEHGDHEEAAHALDCADAVLDGGGGNDDRYRVVRTRASLAYARDRIPEAKAALECALSLAVAREDAQAIASDTNAIGSTLRRLGDYHGAVDALTRSLRMQRATGKVGGAVYNNLGDVYREMGNQDARALRHYREARRIFLEDGKPERAAHVLESMAVVEMAREEPRAAARWLEEALRHYREHGPREFELRTYGRLIQAALAQGDVAAAGRWKASGLAVAASHGLSLPTAFQWQAARLERISGDAPGAIARLRAALAQAGDYEAERADLLQELALAQETMGDRAGALDTLRLAHRQSERVARAKYDRELGWLLTLFETAERDRTIARLESDNRLRAVELRQRTLLLWLTLAVSVAALLGVWLLQQRRRQRERLAEAARLARKEEELARYRREADALAQDRRLLQTLLDSRDDALCLLDAEGLVLAANRAACQVLGRDDTSLAGHALADLLAAGEGAALRDALERMEDAQDQVLRFSASDGETLRARLAPWPEGDGLVVLALGVPDMADDAGGTSSPSAGDPDESAASTHAPDQADHRADPIDLGVAATQADATPQAAAELREAFRRALVELMLSALEVWERGTGTGRLELAERSRIWRVAVDDGRVRARAMERYLGIARLPRNPRWRDVVRTGYYVLEHCAMDADARARLQRQVDAVLAYTRRSALV